MVKITEEEIKEVLNEAPEAIVLEESLDVADSPLNQPVVENEIGHNTINKQKPPHETNEAPELEYAAPELETPNQEDQANDEFHFKPKERDNVPEQEIGTGSFNEELDNELTGEEFELPKSHATQAANTILGVADNMMTIGGGFFIKIKKHKEFYDFDEVIQIIEEQNEKNIRRLKLDDDDKVLLKPLIVAILKKKAKKLTPEQQLMGAVLSILMKKAQMVMEIRAENNILVERILDVIREEKGGSDEELEEEEIEETVPDNDEEQETVQDQEEQPEVLEPEHEELPSFASTVLEISEEE